MNTHHQIDNHGRSMGAGSFAAARRGYRPADGQGSVHSFRVVSGATPLGAVLHCKTCGGCIGSRTFHSYRSRVVLPPWLCGGAQCGGPRRLGLTHAGPGRHFNFCAPYSRALALEQNEPCRDGDLLKHHSVERLSYHSVADNQQPSERRISNVQISIASGAKSA